MIKFKRPSNLNGEVLVKELQDASVVLIANEVGSVAPVLDAEDNLWLRIAEADKSKAQTILDAHSG